jgi:hypothetical protein
MQNNTTETKPFNPRAYRTRRERILAEIEHLYATGNWREAQCIEQGDCFHILTRDPKEKYEVNS